MVNIAKETANVVTSVALTAIMIGIFYFTYIPVVSKKVTVQAVDDVMNSIKRDVHVAIPASELQKISQGLQALTPPDMSKQDKDAKDNNTALRRNAAKYLGILATGAAITVMALWFGSGFNFSLLKLGGHNMLGLVVVTVTYFVFVTLLIRNYKVVDPNVVKKAIVQTLRTY